MDPEQVRPWCWGEGRGLSFSATGWGPPSTPGMLSASSSTCPGESWSLPAGVGSGRCEAGGHRRAAEGAPEG